MCGRYVLRQPSAAVQTRFLVANSLADQTPRYNIAPTQVLPVIVQHGDQRIMEQMTWGLIPSWTRDPKPSYATINARAEGIADKPAYRGPIRRQRCLVPADGFYEWAAQAGRKQPYFIHFTDDRLFAFAGLYDRYQHPDGSVQTSYTIVTTTANDRIAPLHTRMAVILPPEDEAEWLDPGITDPYQVMRLLRPYPAEELAAYPIGPLVNNPRHDGPQLLAPAQTHGQSLLFDG